MKESRRRANARQHDERHRPSADRAVIDVALSPAHRLAIVVVALLALVLYLPALRNTFTYDAVALVLEDERVHTLSDPVRLISSSYWPGEETHALYRPLVTLSFAIDWAIYRGAPWGFHLTNALAHSVASVLVFLLLATLASLPAAVIGAALFAVHPVHVETVAGVVGRADIFAACFSLAALLVWIRLPPRSTAVLLATPALYFFALTAKESAIMLPAFLLLFDVSTRRLRRDRLAEWLRERVPAFALLAIVTVAFLLARVAVLGSFAPTNIDPVMSVVPEGVARVRTALQVWPEILRLLILPWTLLADYGPRVLMPALTWTGRAIAGLVLLVAAVFGGAFALLRGRHRLGLALLWVPIGLLPVSNLLLPVGVMLAERTLYLAVFAVALAAAAISDVVTARGRRLVHSARVVAAMICLLFALRAVLRIPAWRSNDVLFRTLIADRPDSYQGQWMNARFAWRDRQPDMAMRYYRTAIGLWPFSRDLFLEAGHFAVEAGDQRAAREFAEQALGLWPRDILLLRRHAVAALLLGDTTAARETVAHGLSIHPRDPLLNMLRDSIGVAPDAIGTPR